MRILLLGGTSEANALAQRLAGDARFDATLSLAGRTTNPATAPIPTRTGGFGGIDGLAAYLKTERIDLLVDATHPFAANISANTIAASDTTGVPLIALERSPWQQETGDIWQSFDSAEDAVDALPHTPQRVFSGLGRLSLDALERAPQHHYFIRVIDALEKPKALPHATVITARGPFRTDDDLALFALLGIDVVLAKNAGGDAAYAKIAAARRRGIPVMMIKRPHIPARKTVTSVDEAWAAIVAHHALSTERGV